MKIYVAFNLLLAVFGLFSNALIIVSLLGAIKGILWFGKELGCFKKSIPFMLIVGLFTCLDCIDLLVYFDD